MCSKLHDRGEFSLPYLAGDFGRGKSCSKSSSPLPDLLLNVWGSISKQSLAIHALLWCYHNAHQHFLWMVKGTFNKKVFFFPRAFFRVATGIITVAEPERCCAAVIFIFMGCSLWLLFYFYWVHYCISQSELNTPEPWGFLQLLLLTEQTGARNLSRCYRGCI